MRISSIRLCVFVSLLVILSNLNLSYANHSGNNKTSEKKADKLSKVSNKPDLSDKNSDSKSDVKITGLPITFEENKGQLSNRVKFLSRGRNYNLCESIVEI